MDNNDIRALLQYSAVTAKVLSARLVLLLGLASTFGLFCWSMWDPTYNRIGCATIFAVLVFLPIIRLDAGLKKERTLVVPEGSNDG